MHNLRECLSELGFRTSEFCMLHARSSDYIIARCGSLLRVAQCRSVPLVLATTSSALEKTNNSRYAILIAGNSSWVHLHYYRRRHAAEEGKRNMLRLRVSSTHLYFFLYVCILSDREYEYLTTRETINRSSSPVSTLEHGTIKPILAIS